ncbi:hypothetical protein POTOM_028170 [Populus tomentosa]|uniref:Uncharacterized protein n=1 Tax=Populus tomentosa TaxID=118781 RepID=A0A8X7ZDC7_POPTO|nr:hypothetical protein POTOM_028170 [Populus tomentosa]
MDDDSTARLVRLVYNLKEVDMYASVLFQLMIETCGNLTGNDFASYFVLDCCPMELPPCNRNQSSFSLNVWGTRIPVHFFIDFLTSVLPFKFNTQEHY